MVVRALDVMTRDVVSLGPYDTVAQAAETLSRHKISAAPVCAPDGALLGIVSEGDLIAPFRESKRLKRDWWLGILADTTQFGEAFLDYVRQDTRTVSDLMTRHVVTAGAAATLGELAELMISRGVKRIPIMRENKPIGIVSRADILRALTHEPAMLG